jgi:hypothetical protein
MSLARTVDLIHTSRVMYAHTAHIALPPCIMVTKCYSVYGVTLHILYVSETVPSFTLTVPLMEWSSSMMKGPKYESLPYFADCSAFINTRCPTQYV